MSEPFLVLGATGRIGQAMRRHAPLDGLDAVWQSRLPSPGYLAWDILAGRCPEGTAAGVVMCLAGVIHGTAAELALNTDLALAACSTAQAIGAPHVFLASSAAVYGPSGRAVPEDAALAPPGAYGEAKRAMEQAALAMMPQGRLTILRIGNIAGFDTLLGGLRPGVPARLDPVEGQAGGPIRSYIGPVTLARVLSQLATLAAQGAALPSVLNIGAGAVAMGDLLDAASAEWTFGPKNPKAIPRVELDITCLQNLVDLPPDAGQAATMVAEWRRWRA